MMKKNWKSFWTVIYKSDRLAKKIQVSKIKQNLFQNCQGKGVSSAYYVMVSMSIISLLCFIEWAGNIHKEWTDQLGHPAKSHVEH